MAESLTVDAATWRELTHHRPLAALIDIDRGPFACNLDTSWQAPTLLRDACEQLRAGHVQVILVSGARRDAIEYVRDQIPWVWWYVEHGAWRYAARIWSGQPPHRQLDSLAAVLADLTTPAIKVTRTSVGMTAAWSDVDPATANALSLAFASWIVEHPTFRLHASPQRLEARLATANKSDALAWARQRLPEVRCLLASLDIRAALPRDLVLSDAEAPAILRSLAELRANAFPPAPRLDVHAAPATAVPRRRGRR